MSLKNSNDTIRNHYGNKFSDEMKEITLLLIHKTVGMCKQIPFIILYQVSSRLVALIYSQKYK